jgi:hypothetical protein
VPTVRRSEQNCEKKAHLEPVFGAHRIFKKLETNGTEKKWGVFSLQTQDKD